MDTLFHRGSDQSQTGRVVEEEAPYCPPNSNQICPSLKVWSNSEEEKTYQLMCSTKKCSWVIPLAGNAYVTSPEGPPEEEPLENFISDCGVSNWNNGLRKMSTFFHSTRPGYVLMALRLRVPNSDGISRLRVFTN